VLRERGVSWAEIGGALGVSRQAAWKRFTRGPETD
jgi:biotin operon repressor